MFITMAEAGGAGNALRWGPPQRLHIVDLDPARREFILGMIEAERKAQERERRQAAEEAA